MKLRGIIAGAIAFALSVSLAFAQTNQGTSPLSILKGGTGAITAAAARINLGFAATANRLYGTDGSGVATTVTMPAAGLTLSAGAIAFANDLAALEGLSSTGIARRTGTDTWSVGTAVANSELATMAAYTFKGNNTGGSATPTDVDIAALTTKASPAAGDYVMLSDQAASGAWKKTPVSALGGGGSGVSSLNGQTGALAIWSRPQGRLTLTSAVPVTTSDVTGATTLYYTPAAGNLAVTYDGTNVIPKVFAEYSQTTSDTTKSPYATPANANVDIYAWDDGGTIRFTRGDYWSVKGTATVTIASPAVFSFTSHGGVAGAPVRCTTTGALPTGVTAGTVYYLIAAGLTANAFEVAATVGGSAINTSGSQSGTHTCYVGSSTGRGTGSGTSEIDETTPLRTNKNSITNGPAANRGVLVGSVRSNASAQLMDTMAFRWVSNIYNAEPRSLQVYDPAVSWTYTTATFRQANANAANQVDWLQSRAGGQVVLHLTAGYSNSTAGNGALVGIDIDTLNTTTIVNNINGQGVVPVNFAAAAATADYNGFPGIGRHIGIWKERSDAAGTGTFYGTFTTLVSGIYGNVWN